MIQGRTDLFRGLLSSRSGGRNVARFALLSCVLLLCCVAIVFIVRASNSGNNDQQAQSTDPTTEDRNGLLSTISALSPQSGTPRVETEIVTIRPDGFEPKEITRPQGKFFLVVDNRSGLDAVSLSLGIPAGQLLHQVTVPKETLDWAQALELAPGRYLLKEANNPDWVCELTITPK